MLATQVDFLQGMPIFGGIRADMLRVLLQEAREVVVPAGGFFLH